MSELTPDVGPVGRPAALRARLMRSGPDGRTFTMGVAVAMLIGFAIRVAFVLIKQSKLKLPPGDAYWYHFQAKLVADGKGFLNPFLYYREGISQAGAEHPPGFVVILAVLDRFGISSPQAQRLAMCVVGTASIWVIALLGRKIAGARVGIVAAVIAAIYPNMWINDGMLLVETVYILAIAVSLLFTYRYFETRSRSDLVVVSTSFTVAAMTRPESMLLFVIVIIPMVLGREPAWRERLIQIAIAALIPILALAPWVAYNMSRFVEPVTISTGAGQTLAAGNCQYTYGGGWLGYYDLRCLQEPTITVPTGDPSERDPVYRQIALDYMARHKRELPKVVAARVGRLWHVYRPLQSITLDGWVEGRAGGPPSNDRRIATVALYSYFALVPFAIAGAVLLKRRRATQWPLLVQPALATVVAAFTFGVTRYRAGAEITLVLLAAVTLCLLGERIAVEVQSRRKSEIASPTVATNTVAANPATDNPNAVNTAAD